MIIEVGRVGGVALADAVVIEVGRVAIAGAGAVAHGRLNLRPYGTLISLPASIFLRASIDTQCSPVLSHVFRVLLILALLCPFPSFA